MSLTPTKSKKETTGKSSKTPQKRTRTPSLKALESISTADESEDETRSRVTTVILEDSDDESLRKNLRQRRSSRKISPNKKFNGFVVEQKKSKRTKSTKATEKNKEESDKSSESSDTEATVITKPNAGDLQLIEDDTEVTGKNVFGFNTPKKRGGMALAAMNTPKTPKTPKTSQSSMKTPDTKRRKSTTVDSKTPTHIRSRVRKQIAKLLDSDSEKEDFSADDTDFDPDEDSDNSSSLSSNANSGDDDEPVTPQKTRRPIIVPVLPKTPTANRQSTRTKKFNDYVPMCDAYFQAQSSSKIHTSDHTLDRLKNPRLPADRLFSLLAEMKLTTEHESAIKSLKEEYCTYFQKWMCILNEGFNLLLYGLGSKRELLQTFHHNVLSQQTVLVVNGFFPSLMLKDILDSITNEILDAGVSPGNPHEAVDMIEEEFSLIPETHLYLIIHNLDGVMLRNAKSQAILARLAKISNIHLLASIDHINIPLLWDHTKLSNFNFSWWDCTTLLPYTDETAFENSLLVQNSGELALSSLRSVFSSLTTNSRGIYMLIVKHQLKNKSNPNYQGMAFKDLYSSCREAFLVSSDLALRAQLTEFLDHKLVKSKRNVDGSEQLTIPIDSTLLQQFLDEQEKKD